MERVILAGAAIAVACAFLCATLAVVAVIVAWASRSGDRFPGAGCALVGLCWAAIAALLMWMIRG